MGIVWDIEPDDMLVQVAVQYAEDLHNAIWQLCQLYAAEIEAWMKTGKNAPWEDQTTNARQGLYAKAEEELDSYMQIVIDHTMTYGVNLEFDYGGRYAVIAPALDMFAPKLWADIQSLVA